MVFLYELYMNSKQSRSTTCNTPCTTFAIGSEGEIGTMKILAATHERQRNCKVRTSSAIHLLEVFTDCLHITLIFCRRSRAVTLFTSCWV